MMYLTSAGPCKENKTRRKKRRNISMTERNSLVDPNVECRTRKLSGPGTTRRHGGRWAVHRGPSKLPNWCLREHEPLSSLYWNGRPVVFHPLSTIHAREVHQISIEKNCSKPQTCVFCVFRSLLSGNSCYQCLRVSSNHVSNHVLHTMLWITSQPGAGKN